MKLTLIALGALLYLAGTGGWFFWLGPDLLAIGTTEALIYVFLDTCAWLLITFGLAIHIIKTARPTVGGRREVAMRKELIKISEFQRRRWGKNGTPPCPQAIRNHIRNGMVPASRSGNSGTLIGLRSTRPMATTL